MDKNAYAKGWWDAMVVKRDPKGRSEPPSIPVSEISRILINVKKNYMNRYHLGNAYFVAYRGAINDIRKALELRRRSRVSTHI